MASGSINKWARGWLAEVDEARKALERIACIQELRAAQPSLVRDPLGSVGDQGGDGITHVMDNVSDKADKTAPGAYDWACDVLVLFDMMEEVNRPQLRGQLLSGLDAAYMRYRLGASDNEIGRAFRTGKFAIHEDLNAFIEYLDQLGPLRAFHTDIDDMADMVTTSTRMNDLVPQDPDDDPLPAFDGGFDKGEDKPEILGLGNRAAARLRGV